MPKKAVARGKKTSSKLKKPSVRNSALRAKNSPKGSVGARKVYKVVLVKKGPSEYGAVAQQAFRRGVQKQFAHLASLGVATFAEVNGKIVRGVPERVGSRWVIRESSE